MRSSEITSQLRNLAEGLDNQRRQRNKENFNLFFLHFADEHRYEDVMPPGHPPLKGWFPTYKTPQKDEIKEPTRLILEIFDPDGWLAQYIMAAQHMAVGGIIYTIDSTVTKPQMNFRPWILEGVMTQDVWP